VDPPAVAGMLVCCVLAFGAVVAVRTPVFSPVDEKAHFEYVQYVAEHHAVPVLGKHYPSLSVLELDPSFSTKRYGTDPRRMGIVGLAYEDFQPPLYYALAVPAYELSGNLHTKVIVLRSLRSRAVDCFDGALGTPVSARPKGPMAGRLCRLDARPRAARSGGARVTVSNLALVIPLTVVVSPSCGSPGRTVRLRGWLLPECSSVLRCSLSVRVILVPSTYS